MSNTPASGGSGGMRALWRMLLWTLLAPLMLVASAILWFTPLMAVLPLPYAIWLSRGGNGRYAIVPLMVLMAAMGVVFPALWALAVFMMIASLGLWLALRPGRIYYHGITMAFGALFAGALAAMAVMVLLFGDPVSLWMKAVSAQLQSAAPGSVTYELMARVVQADLFMQDASALPQTLYEQVLAMPPADLQNHFIVLTESLVRAQLPGMVIQYAVLGGIGCYAFGARWLGRGKTGLMGLAAAPSGKLPALRLWALPPSANWGMLLMLAIAFILSASARSEPLILASSVVYQLATMVFSVVGLATLDFFLVRRKASLWVRILSAAAIALLLPMALSLLGILEQLFQVRLGYRLREAQAQKSQDQPPDPLDRDARAPDQDASEDGEDPPQNPNE